MLQQKDPFLDNDPIETSEWLDSLRAVAATAGADRADFLLERLHEYAYRSRIPVPFQGTTPYANTIPVSQQPAYPGDRAMERRIKHYMRWNAMAMVVRGNKLNEGIGGHISTYASVATLFEVGFNHFFRGKSEGLGGDQIFFQGHASPGIYARAFLEGRLTEDHLINFRLETGGRGISSYPHPWLMPDFWEFPTVSMGLGPITSIYQARFNRYLQDRGVLDTSGSRVWAFLGDGEMDEPESLGAITLASREQLDNLTWVVNCNLQRLDGPVRGNGNIVQELEAAFRGAGWNVVKCIWGSEWDPLFDADEEGVLVETMKDIVDGEWQRYGVESGAYAREHFFARDPRLLALVANYTDEEIAKLRPGGHDPLKVHAAMKAAVEHRGQPSVILARTIKGYGLGEAGEGRNITHQQKKLNEDEMKSFRNRFEIPLTDQQVKSMPFIRFEQGTPEFEYLTERRRALGGPVPARKVYSRPMAAPADTVFDEFLHGSGDREFATTMAFVTLLRKLMGDKTFGKFVVPIVPDEARTFGMESLFRQYGIYHHGGQKYEPIDSQTLMRYEERNNGQILEEGITEAGSLASWTAAGTAYSSHGINMIPFFIFYSMFGFQRVGDSIWAAADARTKGFLVGATAGRTTLNGEGLQHEDGHSHLHAATVPNCISYDPAFAYEIAVIVQDGIRRMYEAREDVFYYMTVYNEVYPMPPMPDGARDGILKGLYKFKKAENPGKSPRVHLFGSGTLIREALRAQQILAEKFGVAADVWSATSYNELYRDAQRCERWNRLHPTSTPKKPFITQSLESEPWPVVTTSDYLKALSHRVAAYTPAGLTALGADGFGRSDTRVALRRHFETNAEHVAYTALAVLAEKGQYDVKKLPAALKELGINPDAKDPMLA